MESKTWVNVDKNILRQNYKNIASLTNSKKMVVVKSNSYGHGMIECAKIYEEEGADYMGVDSLEEAIELRRNNITTPILVLGWTSPKHYQTAAENDISIMISNIDSLRQATRNLKIHIKVDTGLHRQGFYINQSDEVISLASKLNVEGLYTHLAAAEKPVFDEYTKLQGQRFKEWINVFENAGIETFNHIGASSVAIKFPDLHFDMVRLGIALYGLWPSKELEEECNQILKLKPALKWVTIITEIKEISKGEPIGYDCTEKLKKDSKVAVLPIGYWHGLPRNLSRKGYVIINSCKCKILGNISMDITSVDVTNVDAEVMDEVEIIGSNNPAKELAAKADTIDYELITRINQDIPRIYSKKIK